MSRADASLWRAVWRLHFYAGVFVMPVLLVLAVTGLGIMVKPTLERVLYGDRLYVERGEATVSYEQQRLAVQSAYPGATARSITPPSGGDRSTQFDVLTAGGTDLSVYVDPYTGNVLGAIDNQRRLNNVLEKIHGTLWIGTFGDHLVELVAGWTLVMMATGVYLWWPRGRWRHAFSLRLRSSGRRRLRDLHSTPGAIFAAVVFALVLTGLPWSGFWGKYWGELADATGAGYRTPETPLSNRLAESTETEGLEIAWADDRKRVPLSSTSTLTPASTHGGSADDHYHVTPDPGTSELQRVLSLEEVDEVARNAGMKPGYSIGLPGDDAGVYTLANSWPSTASVERTVFIDQYFPTVLADHGWNQYGPIAKATSLGIDMHMGRQFGVFNAIAMAGACLAVIGAVVTSPLMWWKRRRQGTSGLPRRSSDARLTKGVLIIAVVLGLAFPMLGASMLLVALFDRLVVRRGSRLRVNATR